MSDVSLLATGLLGARIALRLASTGLSVTVWNRTASKAEATTRRWRKVVSSLPAPAPGR